MSDAHALMMLMGILFGWPAGTILAYGILLLTDRMSDRKNERELAKQRDEREKVRKEQGARETQEWINRQQRRIQEQQQEKQRLMEQEQQHWQQWREFLYGDAVNTPDEYKFHNHCRTAALDLLRWCKFAGRSLTRENLVQVFEEQHPGLSEDWRRWVVAEALFVVAEVRNRLNALPMAA